MANIPFFGRKRELKLLKGLLAKKTASLVVIKGRRRIGKSRLVEEFAKDESFFSFTGLPPKEGTAAQTQRTLFSEQLSKQFKVLVKDHDWWDLLWFLAEQTKRGRKIILLDEIAWMGSKDPDFLGKLKAVWDNYFKKNPKLILILCGSVSNWIEENILLNTGFLGRVSLSLTLEELPLNDCDKFWGTHKEAISAYEKFKILCVTGGVPRYLEELKPNLSAEINIRQLCFEKEGILFREFDQIFADSLTIRSVFYKKIVLYLAGRVSAERDEIAKITKLESGGMVTKYLEDLTEAGFLSRDYTWHLKNGNVSKLSHYRLKDNYLRFYLKYILPNNARIKKGYFQETSLTSLHGWDTIMGFQFENLVVNNHHRIICLLGIRQEDVIFSNPFFQRKTHRQLGCQIDYLIQTKFSSVYVCEIKFSRFEIKPGVINEVKEKISKLKLPKHFSYRPVLIHVNGVREDVVDSGFFAEIIDFSNLLKE